LKLAVSRSRPSVPYGANLFTFSYSFAHDASKYPQIITVEAASAICPVIQNTIQHLGPFESQQLVQKHSA